MLTPTAPVIQQKAKPTTMPGSFFQGNARASLFFQPKLTVNTPGDAYEQEADQVADRVMGMQAEEVAQPQALALTPVAPVQRQCAECEKEELQRQEEDGEEKEVQRMPMASSADDTIQRQCTACEQEEAQRKESGDGNTSGKAAPSIVGDVLSSGSGQVMDGGTRQFMESRFGHDFGQVRIHTDSRAAESATAIQAKAYTSGRDVVFGAGEYQPGTDEGRRLLAHELAHVVQQGGKAFPHVQRTYRLPELLQNGAPAGPNPVTTNPDVYFYPGLAANNPNNRKAFVLSGIHGDEPSAYALGAEANAQLASNGTLTDFHTIFVPNANPQPQGSRSSGQGSGHVSDLNREFGNNYSSPNPNAQRIATIINEFAPERVLSIHAISNTGLGGVFLDPINGGTYPAVGTAQEKEQAFTQDPRNTDAMHLTEGMIGDVNNPSTTAGNTPTRSRPASLYPGSGSGASPYSLLYPLQGGISTGNNTSLGVWVSGLGLPIITLEVPGKNAPRRVWSRFLPAIWRFLRIPAATTPNLPSISGALTSPTADTTSGHIGVQCKPLAMLPNQTVQRQGHERTGRDPRRHWGTLSGSVAAGGHNIEVFGASAEELAIIQETLSVIPQLHRQQIPRVVVGDLVGPVGPNGTISRGGNSVRGSRPPEVQRLEVTRYALQNKITPVTIGTQTLRVCRTVLHEAGHWVDWTLGIYPRGRADRATLERWFGGLHYDGVTQGRGERSAEAYWRYFTGGLPARIREILEESSAWRALEEPAAEEGTSATEISLSQPIIQQKSLESDQVQRQDATEHAPAQTQSETPAQPEQAQSTRETPPANLPRTCLTFADLPAITARKAHWDAIIAQMATANIQDVVNWIVGNRSESQLPSTVLQETRQQKNCMMRALRQSPTVSGSRSAWESHVRDADAQSVIWNGKYEFTRGTTAARGGDRQCATPIPDVAFFDRITPQARAACGNLIQTAETKWNICNPSHRVCWGAPALVGQTAPPLPVGARSLTPDERQTEILQASSAPGISRHHWGSDIDLMDPEPAHWGTGQNLSDELAWLQLNAVTYGFIQTFTSTSIPAGQMGYMEEHWHWSYWPIGQALLEWAQNHQVEVLRELEVRWGTESNPHEQYSLIMAHWREFMFNVNQTPQF